MREREKKLKGRERKKKIKNSKGKRETEKDVKGIKTDSVKQQRSKKRGKMEKVEDRDREK